MIGSLVSYEFHIYLKDRSLLDKTVKMNVNIALDINAT